MKQHQHITRRQALIYEIGSSWWVPLIGWDWGQSLAARYYAWKVCRRYRRYEEFKEVTEVLVRTKP